MQHGLCHGWIYTCGMNDCQTVASASGQQSQVIADCTQPRHHPVILPSLLSSCRLPQLHLLRHWQDSCLHVRVCMACSLTRSCRLSSIIRLTKASSPPGHTISSAVPPKAVAGFWPACAMSLKKGGLLMLKAKLSPERTAAARMPAECTGQKQRG